MADNPSDRFWSKVSMSDRNACWPWTGSTSKDGYGHFRMGPKQVLAASRAAYMLHHNVDAIPAGLLVMHSCDNRSCCNPRHLSLGDHAANMRDRNVKGRQARGAGHAAARLTPEKVLELRKANPSGLALGRWARIHRVSTATAYHAKVGLTWKHVGGLS